MPRLTRSEHYQWAVMTWHCIRTYVAVGTCNFAEYKIEGDEGFIDAACRLKLTLQHPELENKTKKVRDRQARRMARNAESAIPEGNGKLTAEDCRVAFLRFLFLSDLMLINTVYASNPFTAGPDWAYCQQWIRAAVHLYESKPGAEQLEEELWADKEFKTLSAALGR